MRKTLDEILKDEHANRAFNKLVMNEAHKEFLKIHLRSIVDLAEIKKRDDGVSSVGGQHGTGVAECISKQRSAGHRRKKSIGTDSRIVTRRVEHRKVFALAKKARRLATQIEDAGNAPPMVMRLESPELRQQLATTPKALRHFAEAWMEAHKDPRGRPFTEESWAIIGLLQFITRITQRPHYPEVADLLNAIDSSDNSQKAQGLWHEGRLKKLMARFKNFARPYPWRPRK